MSKAVRKVSHLLNEWDKVAKRISASPGVVVFLDFDGTLVDIAPRPELVKFRRAARAALQHLARNRNAKVVMISGRRRAELLQFIGIRGIQYFGLYGSKSGNALKKGSKWRKGKNSKVLMEIREKDSGSLQSTETIAFTTTTSKKASTQVPFQHLERLMNIIVIKTS